MLKSDYIIPDFDYSKVVLAPSDICYINGSKINYNGSRLEVPAGIEDYISYGPYTHLPCGVYEIQIDLDLQDDQLDRMVSFEVVSEGAIIRNDVIDRDASYRFTIDKPAADLEFRIKSDGKPFALLRIILKPVEAQSFKSAPLVSEIPVESVTPNDLEICWQLLNRNHFSSASRPEITTIAAITDKLLDQWEEGFAKYIEIDLFSEELLQRSALKLRGHGLSVSALRLARLDGVERYSRILQQYDYVVESESLDLAAAARESKFSSDFLQSLSTGDGVEQYTSAQHGRVFSPCPYTGEMLTSRHAFVVANESCVYNIYRFEGAHVFYVACGSFHNRRAFMYLPQSNILIHLSEKHQFWGGALDTVRRLKILLVTYCNQVAEYLASETRPALMAGTINNLGHFIWNELSGAFRFERHGLLHAIRVGINYQFSFLNTFELIRRKELLMYKFDNPNDLFAGMLKHRLFPVLPASLSVDFEAARSILQLSMDDTSLEEKELIKTARQSARLIFYNLRVHNKSWVEQIAGAQEIAQRSARDGISMSIYLDGLEDCAETASKIQENAPVGVRFFCGVGKPMASTIAWAAACDAYVATVGSGLTILTWIAGKPGVAHSEHHHLTQRAFWSEVRPDVPAPTFVDEKDVIELGYGSYGNYSLSPQVVSDLLWRLLDAEKLP